MPQKPPLPGGAVFETTVKQTDEFDIADETPGSLVDKTRRNFTHKTFYAKIRTEPLQHINEEIQIFIEGKAFKILRPFRIFLFHFRVFNDLKLVELH